MSKRKRNNKTKYLKFISSIICLVCILIYGFIMQNTENTNNVNENISQNQNVTMTRKYLESLGIEYKPDSLYTNTDLIGTFLVSKFLARKINKIDMVSSLKANE